MKQDIVQSIDRAFCIIEALGEGKKSLLEITKMVELNKSTVHRLLHTLIYKGYVIQDESNSHYALTPKILHLGQQIIDDMDIIRVAKPYLNKLNEKTGEVVHLVMIEGNNAIYIDKIEAKNTIRMYSYVGKSIPLYSSAVGKAFLALSDDKTRERYWDVLLSNVEQFTEHTLMTEEALLKDFEGIRQRGYAIDKEENELGVICVAAPIYNHRKDIQYAISISTPKFRLTEEKIKAFGQAVVDTTAEISEKLGYVAK